MMKKLLILSYYFPPLGLGGTQRVAKFVKYLPQCGWTPTVITVKPIAYWARDESLMLDVKEARIIRTESLDPQRIMARLGKMHLAAGVPEHHGGIASIINNKVLPHLLVPDSKILWRHFALKAVRRLLADEKFDAMLTTSPPQSVHLIGHAIAKKYKLPWVADFRDGWAGSHIMHEPTKRRYNRNVELQQKVVTAASAVISVSPGIESSLRIANRPEKFYMMTNGFDPDDFSGSVSRNEKFTLCYSGTINKFADPVPFLDALVHLLKDDADIIHKVSIQFVGLDTLGNFSELVQNRQLETLVEIVGQKDHADSVHYVMNADALLLIAKARETDTFIPGKTFEYIGAQKPVFTISNSRYTNELLQDYPLATVVTDFRADMIYSELKEFLNTNWNSIKTDAGFIEQFNRQKQTEKLAEILNTMSRI